MRTVRANTLVVLLAVGLSSWPLTVLGQDLTNPENYYPLAVGNLWQYSLTDTGLWPDSVIVTADVVGDTLMPNGYEYNVVNYSADSVLTSWRLKVLAAPGIYQRLDTTKALVYIYDSDRERENAVFSLDIAPDLVPPPDSTADSYFFRFDSLEYRMVLGQERSVLLGVDHGSSDSEGDRTVRLAEGIGTAKIDEFGGTPLTWRYVRLLYARVNGQEYGEKVMTDIATDAEPPFALELGTNYPNPFHSSTQIPFVVNEPSRVRLVIYDLLGREIAVLLDEVVVPGRNEVPWKPDQVPSGLYLCELIAGDVRQSRLLLYLK